MGLIITTMERQVKKEHVGKYGKIVAGENEFEKTLYGTVLYVDHFGVVTFIDNDDISHRFTANAVKSFKEEEFVDKSKSK